MRTGAEIDDFRQELFSQRVEGILRDDACFIGARQNLPTSVVREGDDRSLSTDNRAVYVEQVACGRVIVVRGRVVATIFRRVHLVVDRVIREGVDDVGKRRTRFGNCRSGQHVVELVVRVRELVALGEGD